MIPEDLRDELGLKPGDEVEFVRVEVGIVLRKCHNQDSFAKWSGYSNELAGRDAVDYVREMRR